MPVVKPQVESSLAAYALTNYPKDTRLVSGVYDMADELVSLRKANAELLKTQEKYRLGDYDRLETDRDNLRLRARQYFDAHLSAGLCYMEPYSKTEQCRVIIENLRQADQALREAAGI